MKIIIFINKQNIISILGFLFNCQKVDYENENIKLVMFVIIFNLNSWEQKVEGSFWLYFYFDKYVFINEQFQ